MSELFGKCDNVPAMVGMAEVMILNEESGSYTSKSITEQQHIYLYKIGYLRPYNDFFVAKERPDVLTVKELFPVHRDSAAIVMPVASGKSTISRSKSEGYQIADGDALSHTLSISKTGAGVNNETLDANLILMVELRQGLHKKLLAGENPDWALHNELFMIRQWIGMFMRDPQFYTCHNIETVEFMNSAVLAIAIPRPIFWESYPKNLKHRLLDPDTKLIHDSNVETILREVKEFGIDDEIILYYDRLKWLKKQIYQRIRDYSFIVKHARPQSPGKRIDGVEIADMIVQINEMKVKRIFHASTE
jgi:hypothetical protein